MRSVAWLMEQPYTEVLLCTRFPDERGELDPDAPRKLLLLIQQSSWWLPAPIGFEHLKFTGVVTITMAQYIYVIDIMMHFLSPAK